MSARRAGGRGPAEAALRTIGALMEGEDGTEDLGVEAEPEFAAPTGMVPDIRKLAPRLIVAGVLPVAGYALLRPHVSSDFVALLAVSVFPIGDIVVERIRTKHFDPIGVIALIGITVGIIGAVALNGDATLLKVRESALTGVFGVYCLATLFVGKRPVMYYLARSFSTGGDEDRIQEFDDIWELPGVPGRFRIVTTVWAVALIGECGVRLWLAVSVSTQTFLDVSPILNWSVLGGLLVWTTRFSRRGEAAVAAALLEP